MTKIGIVTLNGKHNYGNRLQNYALQTALKQKGVSAITLTEPYKFSLIKALKNTLKPILRHTPLYRNRYNYVMKKMKLKGFHEFDNKYITENRLSHHIIDDFDLFISGSDQVWNPKFAGRDFHFLSFAPPEKRISYAASFGVSEIPADQHEFYKKHLNGMRSISVREQAGVEIVKKLTGRKAELVPDPTILLDSNEWGKLIGKYGHLAQENYVVVYTLHDLDEAVKKQITKFAEGQNAEIYQIMGDFYHPEHKIPDPAEFVARIKYAQAVYTDSFHASVFSIIMHTPFVAFSRKDAKMSSRLVTLLNTYGLSSALHTDNSNIQKILTDENFSKVDSMMATQRNIGIKYLEESINL